MKILIIEDERDIRNALQKGLKKCGYAIDVAIDGQEALEYYFSNYYDLVVLDLNLPKMNGLDVLKEIRKENEQISVLILSARSEVEDKIIGLDLGANDYLEKPFHFNELEARIRALLRRDFTTKATIKKMNEITIDTGVKKVYVDNNEVFLTNKEYGIFEYLLFHQGVIVSSAELIEHIWDSTADSFSNSFKVHINSLRKKLPEGVIKNTRGQGYYVE